MILGAHRYAPALDPAMKRKYATRAPWPRVKRKRFGGLAVDEPGFCGYVTRLDLFEVSPPLWVSCCGERICVADSGYVWMQYFPTGARHVLTAMFDARGALQQWYFDICQEHSLDEHGVPWWDDLYLDLVGLPDGRFELIDREDLQRALSEGAISRDQYDLAWREVRTLMDKQEHGDFPLLETSLRYFRRG